MSCHDAVLEGFVVPVPFSLANPLNDPHSLSQKAKDEGRVTPLVMFHAKQMVRVSHACLQKRKPTARAGGKRSWAQQLCLERDLSVPHHQVQKRRRLATKNECAFVSLFSLQPPLGHYVHWAFSLLGHPLARFVRFLFVPDE